ncbi:serine/threonine-protein kinase [Pseudoxanthomonas suwonensis]|uniref:serine/threonine-protein kinase n=1 Tax=Pseudoxanthomonas suwonensis TaxID=314722 RepID=UPI00069744E3|nr:serine/threonine-protein kinase [Pseudoxanthomonas suwonensis]
MSTTRDGPQHPDPAAIAALASLAFGSSGVRTAVAGTATRHLAFLPIEALELDLSDPEQRDFGDYELLERLGAGGMGVVYRALQKSLDREVALKLLSAGPWASADFIERFRREAQSAARLEHPNIVAIHEIGSRDELNYFSMALVRGPNLAQLLERDGALPAWQAARLMRTIAEALHYAHRLGVLHLDLKPGNVLIDPQGEPQVADFGLARRIDSTLAIDGDEVSGTPSYMAPEQIELKRARLSVATDIYGLGAILYELLTGHPPFDAPTPKEILALALNGTIRRPRRYRADIPEDLEAICLKCLAREPGERYPSAQALADDLGRFLEGRAVSVRPLSAPQRLARWARREPRLVGALAMGLLALLTGLAAALVQRERALESATAAREQTWATRADAAWRLVQQGRGIDAKALLLDNLAELEAQGDGDGARLERLRLGTLAENGPRLIDAIATGVSGRAVDIDPAGERVAVIGLDEQVHLYDVADGRRSWLTATAHEAGFRAQGLPPTRVRFSADGRYLVSATFEPGTFLIPHGRNNVLLDARDGRLVMPPEDRFPDRLDATFGSDGRYAVLRDRNGHAQYFRVEGWEPQGPRLPMPSMAGSWMVGDDGRFVARSANHRIELLDTATFEPRFAHQFDTADGPSHWAAQPGGSLLALGHLDGSVRLLDSISLAMRELRPAPPAGISALAFSNEGDLLLAATRGHVFVWDVATGHGGMLPATRQLDAMRLQADSATGTVFALAPDDAMLWRLADAPSGAFDMRARVMNARMLVTQFGFGNPLPRNAAAYAPAANLAASLERNGELRLWRWRDPRPLPGRAPGQTTETLYFDGRHAAIVEGGTVRIVDVADGLDAAPALVHPGPVSLASFTPDGATLVTVSGRELRMLDWRAGKERHPPVLLADSPLRVAIGPDSTILLATTGAYVEGRFRELASSFDLRDGSVLARDVPLPGPLAGLRFSPDGRHLVHWRYGELEVRDAASLQPVAAPARFGPDMAAARDAPEAGTPQANALHQPGETPVFDAAVSNDGSRVTLLLYGSEPDKPRLVQVHARTQEILRSQPLPFGVYSRLWPRGDAYDFGIWTGASGAAHLMDSDGRSRPLSLAGGTQLVAQATSRDQRWVAAGSKTGVALAERGSGRWASAPLVAHLAAGDGITQLAFAADGNSLLARTQYGAWIWWPLVPDARPTQRISRHLAYLTATASERAPIASPMEAGERRELRETDPGTHRRSAGAPATVELATHAATRDRSGGIPIDLTAAVNRPTDAFDLTAIEGDLGLAGVPAGSQRLLGVDFDIAGVVALRMPEAPQPSLGLPASSPEVPFAASRIAAVHVLLGGCCPLPAKPDGPYAYLNLRYADATSARIPIVHRTHMWFFGGDPGDGEHARIAWVATFPSGDMIYLYGPRLENPHPEREVVALSFEASEYFASSPLVFAATAEPAHDAAGSLPPGMAPP